MTYLILALLAVLAGCSVLYLRAPESMDGESRIIVTDQRATPVNVAGSQSENNEQKNQRATDSPVDVQTGDLHSTKSQTPTSVVTVPVTPGGIAP